MAMRACRRQKWSCQGRDGSERVEAGMRKKETKEGDGR